MVLNGNQVVKRNQAGAQQLLNATGFALFASLPAADHVCQAAESYCLQKPMAT